MFESCISFVVLIGKVGRSSNTPNLRVIKWLLTLVPELDLAFVSVRLQSRRAPEYLMLLPKLRFPLQAVSSDLQTPDYSSVFSCLPPTREPSTLSRHQAVSRSSKHNPRPILLWHRVRSQATETVQAARPRSNGRICLRTSRQRHHR